MHRLFLLIVLAGALLLWLNPPDPERLERWGLDLSAFFPKPLTAEEVVRYTNEFRSVHGLPPLTINPVLSAAAQARALDMKTHRYFAHHNPDTGEGPVEAIESVGYVAKVSAENIAKGNWRSDQALV
ncbi:MAG: CAP domain-containing protein, partial [Gammaproteobacteria bacterium]